MSDFETVAQAEHHSDLADWVQELTEEMGAPVCRDGVWTFPASSEGEE